MGLGVKLELEKDKEFSAENAIQKGREDRDPGIGPVRVAFSGNGQEEVGEAGPEIAGGIDGLSLIHI